MSVKYRNENGDEVIIAGLTPGGDIEAGAVDTRSGTFSVAFDGTSGKEYNINIAFDAAMSDADYEVIFDFGSDAGWTGCSIFPYNKTANGFVAAITANNTSVKTRTISYKAWKIYSVQHDKQNSEAIATIQQAIPAGAGISNKLTTKSYVDNADSALNTRLSDLEDLIPTGASISNQLATKSITDNLADTKQDNLTFDEVPTSESDNPVKSGGVYSKLIEKAPIESPIFTGTPKAPTRGYGSCKEYIATTEFVTRQINVKRVGSMGGENKIGWYRLALPEDVSDLPGTISIFNSYGTGGPTSLYMYFNLSTYCPILKLLGQARISTSPITNARLVRVDSTHFAIDFYYNRNSQYQNPIFLQIMPFKALDTSQYNLIPIDQLEFLGLNVDLPTGNTLLTTLDFGANVSFHRFTISYPSKPSVTFRVPMFSNTTASNCDWSTYTAWEISRSSYGTRVKQIAAGQTGLTLTVTNQSTGEITFGSTFTSSFGTDLIVTTVSSSDYNWYDANK